MAQTVDLEGLREALYYGHMVCDGCNTRVDLSDADDAEEARQIWNQHIREEHPENA